MIGLPVQSLRDVVGRNAQRTVNALRLAGGLDRPQTGCSPHVVIWRRDRATVRHYTSGSGGLPVLLVPSLINRSHIWDLRPGDSFVEDLHAQGYDVYLVDWGVPDERDAHNSMATYVDEYLPTAVAAVRDTSGADPVVMGHCFGGVIALLWAASTPEPPPALVCLGVPTNWLEMGPLAQMTRHGRLDPEDLLDDTGNVPPVTLLRAFQMLRPLGDLAGYVTLWTRLHDRRATQAIRALTDWAHDHVLVPRRRVRRHGPTAQPGERVGHRQCESRRPGTQPRRHQDPGSRRLRHLRPRHPADVGDAARRRPRLRRRRGRRGEGRPHRPARRQVGEEAHPPHHHGLAAGA